MIRSEGQPASHVMPTSIVEALGHFADELVQIIVTHTNEEAARVLFNSSSASLSSQWSDTSFYEVLGFIGLLLDAGVSKSNMVDCRDLWSESRGFPIFRATVQ